MQVNETQQEEIYIIFKCDHGDTTVEGCYTSKVKAERRLDVLLAKVELNLAIAREMHPDKNLDHSDLNSFSYWMLEEKLIR